MKKHYKRRFLLLVLGGLISTTSWSKENSTNDFLAERPGHNKIISKHVAQTLVSGKVTDENGEGLPGVTVVLKGSAGVGTVTALDGSYRLEIPEGVGNPTLVFSFVGYLSEEAVVGNRSQINMQLMPDIKSLEEVVVVGYGTQRKKDLTGAVTAISTKDFNEGFNATPEQLISGKVAGVQITSNGGAPGSGSQIRIRGGASLAATNDPLIVIDGVPLSTETVSGAANPLSFLNPEDIETFNILKDASAAAIYGSRASNGVIIITTKKGAQGQKLQVNFSTLHSISTVPNTIGVLNGEQYRAAVNERGTETQQAMLGTENTNWQELIYQNAYSTDNNLSVSGAAGKLPYRVSVGYLNQDGILKTSNFQRTTAAVNLNPSFLDDHLKVNLNLKGMMTNSRFAEEGAIGAAVSMDPTKPVYSEGNSFGGYYQWTGNDGTFNPNATVNPLSMLEQRSNIGEVQRSIGNLQFDYKFHFLPELRANLNLGYDLSSTDGNIFEPATYAPVVIQNGAVSRYAESRRNTLVDFYLNYVKDLDAINSRIDLTTGYSYQDFFAEEPDFITYDVDGNPLGAGEAGITEYEQNRLISVFARLNYVFNDKYLMTATVRRDGSSRFSEQNRWGTFPSLALAWNLDQEEFLKNSAVVSALKLRLGYGLTGQQNVGDNYFPYLARYTYSDPGARYRFGDQWFNMYRPAPYDVNLKWEETETYNVGLDYGLFNNRVNGSLEYYKKFTNDLLATADIPAGTNFTNRLLTNVGNLEAEGVEAVVNFYAIDTEDLRWELSLNGTYNRMQVTSLSLVETDDPYASQQLVGGIGGGTGGTVQVHTQGFTPYSFYVYKQVYDENGQPIENLFADLNGDGVINENDRYRYQAPNPDFYYGFSSQLSYKKWSLGFVMRGLVGNYVYNNINSQFGNYSNIAAEGYLRNITTDVLNTGFQNRPDELMLSDYYVENASFLRMENINLAYDFGRLINDKIRLGINANVRNAFTITNYTGLDPEIPSGIDNNFYPRARVFAVGVNVGF